MTLSRCACRTEAARTRLVRLAALSGALAALGSCSAVPPAMVDFSPIFSVAAPAVVGIADDSGVIGSGFRIQPSRLFVTAAHVTSNPHGALRLRWQGKDYPAQLLDADAVADVALLRLTQEAPIPALPIAAPGRDPIPGAWILVLGCPFGGGVTATAGILSAAPGAVLEPKLLQTRMQLNAAVNAGNSGGPVIDQRGRVIGVANASIPGGYGLGFAIPVAAVSKLLTKADQKH